MEQGEAPAEGREHVQEGVEAGRPADDSDRERMHCGETRPCLIVVEVHLTEAKLEALQGSCEVRHAVKVDRRSGVVVDVAYAHGPNGRFYRPQELMAPLRVPEDG